MSGDAGGIELAVLPKEMYRATTHDLPPLPVETIITPLIPEQVAKALGGELDLGRVLHILGGEIMPFPRPAGPDTAWDTVGRTIGDLLRRVPGQAVLGGKPVELNPLASIAPDKSPAIASLSDSLKMVPRPPLREISLPPYDSSVVTRLVPPPWIGTSKEVNGGPRVDLPLKAILFHGGKNPNAVGQEELTDDEWARIYGLLPGLNNQTIPTDSSPRDRAARHLASRLLQVEEAIDNGPGGREGLRRGPGGITPRAGEAMFLLLAELSLKNALEGLAQGNSTLAQDALRDERQGCEIIVENPNDRNITGAGIGNMQGWAGGRAHFLQLLEGELQKPS